MQQFDKLELRNPGLRILQTVYAIEMKAICRITSSQAESIGKQTESLQKFANDF